jgi:uncharacterized membrane protein HdeD (DUF308 family)
MELEREPRQQHTPHARPTKTNATPQTRVSPSTAKFERVSYAREVCYTMGVIFLAIGLIGFVVDNLMGTHLSYAHNMIHVISGVAAIISAYNSRKAAQVFAIAFGALYGALGVLGFIFGIPAEATVGHVGRDSSLWVIAPEVLEFGSHDHILHLIFGAVFIGAALIHYQRRTDASAMYN